VAYVSPGATRHKSSKVLAIFADCELQNYILYRLWHWTAANSFWAVYTVITDK